ncbi:hypothetical protein Y032_0061g3281 [Ancylostoma ceylanicum]|uniref:Tetraspanin family protein n=1 Tax=Ancylostoma ceylanicum TaxID=53326 RepID=A0A016U2W8_9BILA|nr:hypothetical protein Y032_0061g3281 [Ancylostoma ceylanicum]
MIPQEQDSNHRDWLRVILNREKCKQLSPEARLAVVHQLISECQKRGVERVLKRNRTRLVWWKYISWIVALCRILCMSALLWIIWELRFFHFQYLLNFSGAYRNLIFKMVYQGLALGIFLAVSSIAVELLLMLSFQIQRSSIITFIYALSMIVVVLLIAMGPFLSGFYANSRQLVADLYAYIVSENVVDFLPIAEIHEDYQCCGFQTSRDWFSKQLFQVTTLVSSIQLISNDIRRKAVFVFCRLARLQKMAELPASEMEGFGNGIKFYHKEESVCKQKHPFISCYNTSRGTVELCVAPHFSQTLTPLTI